MRIPFSSIALSKGVCTLFVSFTGELAFKLSNRKMDTKTIASMNKRKPT
jgi:hypothetical protein